MPRCPISRLTIRSIKSNIAIFLPLSRLRTAERQGLFAQHIAQHDVAESLEWTVQRLDAAAVVCRETVLTSYHVERRAFLRAGLRHLQDRPVLRVQ